MSSNFWIDDAEEFLSFVHPSERDVLHPAIVEMVNSLKPKRYLDYGAGDGRMSSKLAASIPIDIYDISQIMISHSKKNLGKRLKNIYDDPKNIPLRYYDVVVCSMVLICIDNKKEFHDTIAYISESLVVGGRAIFSLTHPCFRMARFSDFYTEFSVRQNLDYFQEGQPFKVTIHDVENTNSISFEDYHWSLSYTLNTIVKAGLNVTEILETNDDLRLPTANTKLSPFIIISAQKNEN